MNEVIFQALGGLGLFLFGMKIMSEGLQKLAGRKMRQILQMVSNNRFVGFGVGALVTSIIQSSSATTVMLVSFVDAGLMTLRQAVGVILGANVGTTVTAQLIAFNIQHYALPAIALGVALKFFLSERRWSYVGDVMLGFGLVFFGLATMKAGFAPLRGHEVFISFFTKFQADSLPGITLCVLVGAILTMLLQSSSATVGLAMALASEGLLDFSTSTALILGDNIGTTVTAQLASLGANTNARRAANAHTLFNVLGVLIMIAIFPFFLDLVETFTRAVSHLGPPEMMVDGQQINISRYIANSHTLFNVVAALIFLLLIPYLVKASKMMTREKIPPMIEEIHKIKYIDSKFIHTPDVALAKARAEIKRMGDAVQVMFRDVVQSIRDRRAKDLDKWRKREDAIDNLQREITHFLVHVMQTQISPEESSEVSSQMRIANNLERTGDAIENLAYLGEDLIEQNLYFSEEAVEEYDRISTEVSKFLTMVVEAIDLGEVDMMPVAEEMENNIDTMRENMKNSHITRLQDESCSVDSGLIFLDMLSAFEKMGDYCYNIAQSLSGVK
jgi:phosphate:Na+ symporter